MKNATNNNVTFTFHCPETVSATDGSFTCTTYVNDTRGVQSMYQRSERDSRDEEEMAKWRAGEREVNVKAL